MRRTRRERTAHHEAGHAVAHWDFGIKFREAHIIPNDSEGMLGHVLSHKMPKWFQPEHEGTDRQRILAEKHIIIFYAGQVAEGRFLGKAPRVGHWHDDDCAAVLASHYFGNPETESAFLNFCFLRSRDLVRSRWWAVEAVARALLARGKLSYSDTVAVIRDAADEQMETLGQAKGVLLSNLQDIASGQITPKAANRITNAAGKALKNIERQLKRGGRA